MHKLTKLRKEINFNSTMGGVLAALKGVASAEYFRLQAEKKEFADFEIFLKGFFESISIEGFQHPFLNPPSGPKNIILITSDASFLGKLNMAVVNTAFQQYNKGDLITVVGRQGGRYIEESGKEFSSFPGIDDAISYEGVVSLREYVINTFLEGKLSGVVIIYPHFVSFAVQTIQQLRIFPCRFLFSHRQSEEGQKKEVWEADSEERILLEPSKKSVVAYLIKVWVTRSIYQVFWGSKLSEWAARVVHLDKSVDETERQNKDLRFKYFRLLHQMNDQNIREIFCNRLVLSKETRKKEFGENNGS